MKTIKSVRGMHDLLPNTQSSNLQSFITRLAVQTATRHNFKYIQTPQVEFAHLFERTLGTTSDVIKKEMFLLQQTDLSDQHGVLCLRPEGTAGVVRSVIQHSLYNSSLFYLGNMYRYEKPQKGRLRQFTQFGVEKIGEKNVVNTETSMMQDIEVLQVAHAFLNSIGVLDHVTLELNSLGSIEERNNYANDLKQFFREYQTDLSQESQTRLKLAIETNEIQNIWRILDSKLEEDIRIITEHKAPLFSEYYTAETRERFDALQETLRELGIKYTVNPYLVRGLDYYSHTTFEFTSPIAATNNQPSRNVAVLAGGRYNDLFKMIGRDTVEAIGWAAGIERLAILMEQLPEQTQITNPTVGIIGMTGSDVDPKIKLTALKLAQALRSSTSIPDDSVVVGPIFVSKVLNGLQRVEKEGATTAILLGSREVERGTCSIKNLVTRTSKEVSIQELLNEPQTFI